MSAGDALETFAAIAIGIAGFSAIVIALLANAVVYDGRRLSWGLGLVFCWALGASFFSVFPFILYYFDMPERTIWRSGLLVMGGFVAIAAAVALAVDRRLNRAGLDIQGRDHGEPVKRSREMALARVLYAITVIALWMAGVAMPVPGFYLVGLTVMLALSVWVLLFFFFFTGLLHRRPRGVRLHDAPGQDGS